MSVATITPQELDDLVNSGEEVEILDVRMPFEFETIHAAGAFNIPLDRFHPAEIAAKRKDAENPLYIICRSGNRSGQACEKLRAAGYHNAVNVAGGVNAWDEAGLPVVRGKQTISLERQVRIAAGSLVLVGVLLGWLVSPYWFGLAGLVGAGLVFAGVTDFCGMAIVLGRMPWNQVRKPACTAPPGS